MRPDVSGRYPDRYLHTSQFRVRIHSKSRIDGSFIALKIYCSTKDPSTFALAPMDSKDPELYTRFTALKNTNPGLQTWISIGGWSMNDPDQPTASTFSDLAGSPDAQSNFFASVLSFLETYGFDGVDLDWLFDFFS